MIKAIKKYFNQKKYFKIIETFVKTYILHPENYSVWNEPGSMTSCLYRHPKGNKCAVGMYIPDELYDSNWEGLNVIHIWGKVKNILPIDDSEFWRNLQINHDAGSKYPHETRVNNILALAKDYCPSYKNRIEKLFT